MVPSDRTARYALDRRLMSRWHYGGGGLHLICTSSTEGPLRYRGQDLRTDEALVLCRGVDHELVAPRRARGFEIFVDPDVVMSRGWRIASVARIQIPAPRRRALERVCREVTVASVRWESDPWTIEKACALRDRLVDATAAALQPYLGEGGESSQGASAPSRAQTLVHDATAWMTEAAGNGRVSVTAMARDLGAPERTLYHAFRTCLGVSPYEFHRLERMHAFRTALREASSVHGAVSRAARETGFHDASRLGQAYRRQFGETPRQSLRRWQAASASMRVAAGSNECRAVDLDLHPTLQDA